MKIVIENNICCLESQQATASSLETSSNHRLVKERRGQRKPKTIQIETYANVLSGEETKGVLPKNSREQTPLKSVDQSSEASSFPETPTEVKFFSGNPFVEQTTGILHLYKKKLVFFFFIFFM
jgi:hypothetical protein